MKNLTYRYFFFLLPALLWPGIFLANSLNADSLNTNSLNINSLSHIVGGDTCPAPAPAWLIATKVTPSSISLAWEASMIGLYYKVEGDDITAGTPLPTKYCTTPYITYDSLPSGHEFEFRVSASYCPNGAYGDFIAINGLVTIVIDFVIDFDGSPCTPEQNLPTGNGVYHNLCVAHDSDDKSPYDNVFVGNIQWGLIPVNFGLAANGDEFHIDEVGNNAFVYFDPIYNQNYDVIGAYCKSNTDVNLFKIDNVGIGTQPGITGFKITFYGSYSGGFNYCNSQCGFEPLTGGGGESAVTSRNTGGASSKSSGEFIQTSLSPNPFSQSTTFRYTLNEPGPVDINLYDAMGRLVKVVQKTALQEAGTYEATVDGAGLPDGVYFLHTMTGQNREVFSLVKQE